MPDKPRQAIGAFPAGEHVHRIVAALRLAGGLVVLGLGVVVVLTAIGLIVRAVWPVSGSLGGVIFAGVLAVLALAGGATLLELTGRKAKKADTLEGTVAAYKLGCAIAGAINFLAGMVTVILLFTGGISGGRWVPILIVTTINVFGMVLAIPRVRHVRALHYRPTLPISRV
jgi:hypothetical protein